VTGARRLNPADQLMGLCDAGSLEFLRSGVTSSRLNGRAVAGDGVLVAAGCVAGRPVFCYAQDAAYMGGSLGEVHADSVVRLLCLARERRVPVVGFMSSAGARMQEGMAALTGYARIFRVQIALRGVVPQIAVIGGTCAGGSAYSPALADFAIMRDGANAFLTGPRVVRAAMREDVTMDALGGLEVHERNGVAQFAAADDEGCLRLARELLGYLPQSATESTPRRQPRPPVDADPGVFVPDEPRHVYDVRAVLRALCDGGELLESEARFARNLVTALGRISGRAVAFVANQPAHLGGVIDVAAAEKASRFLARTTALNLPLVTIVDTPGFLPGVKQERMGVIRYGAEMLRAFADARVACVTVILRKAFGGAYITMNSQGLGAHLSFAWPGAQLGVMGAEQAVAIVHRRRLAADPSPALRRSLADRYADEHLAASAAAREGFIDEIIDPPQTRERLAWALEILDHRRAPAFGDEASAPVTAPSFAGQRS
jgi:acetyl-CoA carboxylase carboxyltransferase component